jgi:hypothetical protein
MWDELRWVQNGYKIRASSGNTRCDVRTRFGGRNLAVRKHVVPETRSEANLLDEPESASGCVDAEAFAAAEPVVGILGERSRKLEAARHQHSFCSETTTVAGDKTAAIVGPETRLRPLKRVGSGA